MCKVVAYMRISTKEERGKQKFTRQEQAIQAGDTILFKMYAVLQENMTMDIKGIWNCLIRA